MTNSTETSLPNPFTPMAFLEPDVAYQATLGAYVVVGSLTISLWDILSHLNADWKLVTRYKVSWPTVTYILSRLSTLAYALVTAVFQTMPSDNCAVLGKAACSIYHVTVSSTTLLFFFRVRAIFNKNRYITITFLFLWVCVVGGGLAAMFSLGGMNIGTTKYCMYINYIPYVSAANITIAVFDTTVFLAITWRLLIADSKIYTKSDGNEFDLFGRHLPAFTRALLHDGQKYYMIVAVINLLTLIMDLDPTASIAYRTILILPSVVVGNIMACRVFRNTKMYHDDESVSGGSAMVFRRTIDISTSISTGGGLPIASVAQEKTLSVIV